MALAVQYNELELARLLLQYGSPVGIVDAVGRAPIHSVRSPEMLDLLLEAGADVGVLDHEGRSALSELWGGPFLHGKSDGVGGDCAAPLAAAAAGRVQVHDALIDAGCMPDRSLFTALADAPHAEATGLIELALAAPPDVRRMERRCASSTFTQAHLGRCQR